MLDFRSNLRNMWLTMIKTGIFMHFSAEDSHKPCLAQTGTSPHLLYELLRYIAADVKACSQWGWIQHDTGVPMAFHLSPSGGSHCQASGHMSMFPYGWTVIASITWTCSLYFPWAHPWPMHLPPTKFDANWFSEFVQTCRQTRDSKHNVLFIVLFPWSLVNELLTYQNTAVRQASWSAQVHMCRHLHLVTLSKH